MFETASGTALTGEMRTNREVGSKVIEEEGTTQRLVSLQIAARVCGGSDDTLLREECDFLTRTALLIHTLKAERGQIIAISPFYQ